MKHFYFYLAAILFSLLSITPSHAQLMDTNYGLTIGDISYHKTSNRMEVDFTIFIENVKIRPNHSLRITPYLTNGQEMMQLPAVVIDGRRRHIVHERKKYDMVESADTYIRRFNRKAQIVDYQTDVMFENWMENSELFLREEWVSCHDIALAEAITPIASNSTTSLATNKTAIADPANPTHKQPQMAYIIPQGKRSVESSPIDILFPVNKSAINSTFMSNQKSIEEITEALKSDNIGSVALMGYASPEGPYAFNTALAAKRAEAVKKHLYESGVTLPIEIMPEATPTDWDALKTMLVESSFEDKEGIIDIINDAAIQPADKNSLIKQKFPATYALMLQNWYPMLRKAVIDFKYNKPRSIDQAKAQLKQDPTKLSLEDIYLIAYTYEKGSKEWNDIILLAVANYSQSPEARINAANVAIANGDYAQAAEYLNGVPTNIPQATNARGILALAQGKYQEAMRLFQSAENAGITEAAYNLSILKELMTTAN